MPAPGSVGRVSTVLVVPAAGNGTRLGRDVPKALVEIRGRTILERCLAGALRAGAIDRVVVAAPGDSLERVNDIARGLDARVPIDVVIGGPGRVESVRLALDSLREVPDHVLVHDAARCFTPPEVFARVVSALESGAACVVPALPVTDTIKRRASEEPHPFGPQPLAETLDRSGLLRIQTPQGFEAQVLLRAHRAGTAATDDAGMVEATGLRTVAVTGDERALKITTPWDLTIAEMIAERAES